MRARHRAVVSIVMALAVGLTACGGDDEESDATEAPAATTEAPAVTTAAGTEAPDVTEAPATTAAATTEAPATTEAAPAELIPTPVAFTPSLPGLPQYVGLHAGFYEAQGLAVEPVQVAAGPDMGAAQIAGDITFAGNIPNNQIGLIEAGFDVVAVGQQVGNQFFDILVSSQYDLGGATEWQDVMAALDGANVGVVAAGAAAEDIARTLFREAGLDPDAQTYIATGLPDTTLAAMSNGEIDMAITFDPAFVIAEAQGIGVQPFSLRLGDGPDKLHWPSLLPTASREWVAENPDIVEAYLAGTTEAIAMIQDPSQQDAVIDIMVNQMGIPEEIAVPMLESNRDFFTSDMAFDVEGLDRAGAWVAEIGKASKPYTAADFTTAG